MSEIYTILSKHFNGESTPEEEKQIEQFRLDNLNEYVILLNLWKNKSINVKDFDSSRAWLKMNIKEERGFQKIISIIPNLRKVASIAILLIIASFVSIKYFIDFESSSLVFRSNEQERNKKIELSDGTMVYLNKNAQLIYPSTFNENSREVKLSGEAFFEVMKDQHRPFVITTMHSDITVLGTSFNINTNHELTEVSVKTGEVKVESMYNKKTILLTPNKTAQISNDKLVSFPTKNQNYLSWQNGEFIFHETPIKDVIEDLNSFYDQKIQLANNNTKCLFTSSFKNFDLKDIIEILRLSCDLKVKEIDGHIEIH